MKEQRSHPRAPVELEVTYRRLNSFFADYTRNISKGGMFVRTDKPVPVGTRFVFQLKVPSRPEPFELSADVVRVETSGEAPGMGLEFVWADERARESFERAVEELMSSRLGAQTAAELLKN